MAPSGTRNLGTGSKCCAEVDGKFTVITLGNALGTGAEGTVYRSVDDAWAVKIYDRELVDDQLLETLRVLISARESFVASQLPIFARPLATVHTRSRGAMTGDFAGVVMRLGPKLCAFRDIVKRTSGNQLYRISTAYFPG
jgi:hypothetical protein